MSTVVLTTAASALAELTPETAVVSRCVVQGFNVPIMPLGDEVTTTVAHALDTAAAGANCTAYVANYVGAECIVIVIFCHVPTSATDRRRPVIPASCHVLPGDCGLYDLLMSWSEHVAGLKPVRLAEREADAHAQYDLLCVDVPDDAGEGEIMVHGLSAADVLLTTLEDLRTPAVCLA